jgi:hypothetical protein
LSAAALAEKNEPERGADDEVAGKDSGGQEV